MDKDDQAKTLWMGVLIPLACAAFGVYRILYPREFNRGTVQFYEGDAVVGLGINALGVALFVHAIGFVPYQKIPALKYLLVVVSIGLFLYGLARSFSSQT